MRFERKHLDGGQGSLVILYLLRKNFHLGTRYSPNAHNGLKVPLNMGPWQDVGSQKPGYCDHREEMHYKGPGYREEIPESLVLAPKS